MTDEGIAEGKVASFYERYPYPPRAQGYAQPASPDFWSEIFQWEALGQCDRTWKPKRILVVGCGTTQAVAVAHNFPDAEVLGIDLSAAALRLSEDDARATGVGDRLKHQHISMQRYDGPPLFDLIFCDGVLHHLAEPWHGVASLQRLLTKQGLLHLMVYHRNHTLKYVDFAAGVRLLLGTKGAPDELERERAAIEALLGRALESGEEDALIHPVKHVYTLARLAVTLESEGLKLLAPTGDSKATGNWNEVALPPPLQDRYVALPALQRWRVREMLGPPVPLLSFWVGHRELEARGPIVNAIAFTTALTIFDRLADGRFAARTGVPFTYRVGP